MQKAADDLKKQHEIEAADKKKFIESRVARLDLDGLDHGMKWIAVFCQCSVSIDIIILIITQ